MIRPAHLLVLGLFVTLSSTQALAQVATGTPPLSSVSGGPDAINLGNLNAQFKFPIVNKPGRGTNFTYTLTYDTSVWQPVTASGLTTWQPVNNLGWNVQTAVATGYMSYTLTTSLCYSYPHIPSGTHLTFSNWAYHDLFGAAHPFSGSTFTLTGTCGSTSSSLNTVSPDGSGYNLQATGGNASVVSTAGKIIHPPVSAPSGASSFTDRNGNQITDDGSGHYYDTLSSSSAVLTVTTTAPSPTNPVKLTYTAPSGASASYQLNYTNYTVATNFGVSGIGEYKSSAAVALVTGMQLPDGSQYSFAYEATPGSCTPYSGTTCTTARLKSITLPTGGTISYLYYNNGGNFAACTTGNNGIFSDGSASCLQRTTADGTSTYTRSLISGSHWQTLVSDATTPTANQTLIDFQKDGSGTYNYYETERQTYQGPNSGTVLATLNTCYNAATPPCTGTSITTPFSQRTVNTILPGSSNFQSQHTEKYDSYGDVTETDDYDWGSGTVGSLLKKTAITYAALTNIVSFPSQVTTTNTSGTVVSQTKYNYGDTVTATSGTPQHTTPPGSRGNALSINYYTQGSTYLTQSMTYFDTGNVQTVTDVNSASTTYIYSDPTSTCGNTFPTSINEPLSLTQNMTWNCPGGVQATSVDENGKTISTTWNDPYFWRPASVTDQETNVTVMGYEINPTGAWVSLPFNSNQSIVNTGNGFDGLGRLVEQNHLQAPGVTTYDQVTQSYDSNGRPWKTSMPCVTTGAWTCPITGTTTTYDALNRPIQIIDLNNGYTSYSYLQNDVLVTVGPNPSGENTKRRQLEYNALGQLTSVCELTSGNASWPGGTCGQSNPLTGYWTKYNYDPLGNLTGVTQNAQSSSTQTRSYAYDFMGRLTSETNPESGTTTYSWDSATGVTCYQTSSGDLIKKVDQNGNWTCYNYDALHRLTDVGNSIYNTFNPCKRFRYDGTNGVLGSKPSGVAVSNVLGRLVEVETDTCASPITQSSILTDEWFSYTTRGEVSDLYESTPHSGGYYHTAATYWANGAVNQLTAPAGYSAGYNLDGEGRVYSTAAADSALSATTYNAGSLPTQLTYASADTDNFTYDPNTNRMTQYKYTVNGQSVIGTPAWNANGTLAQLAITDPFDSANAQTCTYTHDDLTRIASANCGTAANQTFVYDAFGNIQKSGSPYSFQPNYSTATNRMTSISGSTPTYDADGNVLNDFLHSYTWDVYGRPITIDGVSVTYDALGSMVEENKSGAYSQFVYAPTGAKIEIMNGQTNVKSFVPLPGGAMAEYSGSNIYYRHSDHLGSPRFVSTSTRTMYSDVAYAPFGEPYAQAGTTDLSFTGQNQDTVSNLYDFPAREYGIQGRWPSPDPAGLAAVDPINPQSWNRYAYVLNNPLALIDPTGLVCNPATDDEAAGGDPLANGTGIFTQEDCAANGGTWGNSWLGGGGSGGSGGGPGVPPMYCAPTLDANGVQNGVACTDDSFGINGSGGKGPTAPNNAKANTINSKVTFTNGLTCVPSIFNPSCKAPTCIGVFFDAAVEADPLSNIWPTAPPGLNPDDAAKAAAAAAATRHIVNRGLSVPLRSSIVRNILSWGEFAASAAVLLPVLYQESVGLKAEYNARKAGSCSTAFGN